MITSSQNNWRSALKSQPAYRIVNRTICCQTVFVYFVGITGVFLLFLFYTSSNSPSKSSQNLVKAGLFTTGIGYNHTYPITKPIITKNLHSFRIGIIADLDTNSLSKNEKNTWFSYLKTGFLRFYPKTRRIKIDWDQKGEEMLKTNYALKGRGLELSELVTFDGRILTFDDRTGLVFELVGNELLPWLILMDGDGRKKKGFKSEWATVKNENLYVGSIGKEWTSSSGKFENNDPQYVKIINKEGQIRHINWVQEYERLRKSIGITWPGYMIHESGLWSHRHKKWFFLPRRCSKESYEENLDERRGCSVLLVATEQMYDVRVVEIGNSKLTRGFSSFKFIPTTNDEVIVALRTEELNGKTATFITAFTVDGEMLMDDEFVANEKYEGFEFI